MNTPHPQEVLGRSLHTNTYVHTYVHMSRGQYVQYMTQVTYANSRKSFHLTVVNPQKWAAYTCGHTRKASSAYVRILSNTVRPHLSAHIRSG